jgi:hypothetical protein
MPENYVLLALIVAWLAVKLTTVTQAHRRAQRAAADKKEASHGA